MKALSTSMMSYLPTQITYALIALGGFFGVAETVGSLGAKLQPATIKVHRKRPR